jgi:hypothetical protein
VSYGELTLCYTSYGVLVGERLIAKMISRRRGIIFLGEQDLAQILNLPDNFSFMGIEIAPMRMGVNLLVTSPDLPMTPAGSIPPEIPITAHPEFNRSDEDCAVWLDRLSLVPDLSQFNETT